MAKRLAVHAHTTAHWLSMAIQCVILSASLSFKQDDAQKLHAAMHAKQASRHSVILTLSIICNFKNGVRKYTIITYNG